jgi:dTDP-4-amino-4,6-dideoxygalactose transaminase
MTLMAWGIGPGDAVFTTPFTFIATAETARLLGAVPVFVDIDPATFNLNAELLEPAIQKAKNKGLTPRAVIPVDLFGLPADYARILAVANQYGLLVLEDAAQSFGAVYSGKRAGHLCNAAATSFFPSKPLGCYGDGGAVFTDDSDLYEKLKSIRVHGQGASKYDNIRLGINGRLDAIQAAVLLVKLGVLDSELAMRQSAAERYTNGLERAVVTPRIPEHCRSSWAQYSVLAKDGKERGEMQDRLLSKGIQSANYYPKPLHLQRVFSDLGYVPGDMPVAEEISSRIFSLPMHPYLNSEEIDAVILALKSASK